MKLMVIDGNSIINRAYYGIRPLTTRDGLYTHAVLGFITTLQRLLDEEKPEAVCVTFDRREPTFRHQEDSTYKAQRKGMPEELAMQLPVLKEVLDAMSIPRYEMVGYEADDLIGTISRKCEAQNWECVVVTGDKDSLQLITDKTKVKLVSTRMGQTTTRDMTPTSFYESYGFSPIHMIDLKALMGDSSDNITGVPGIGEKTAMDLIHEYESINAIYEQIESLHAKPGVITKLKAGEKDARHSYWLATIVTDAPLEFLAEDNLIQPFKPEIYDLFLRLEFKKLIDKYNLQPAKEIYENKKVAKEIVLLDSEDKASSYFIKWEQCSFVTVLLLADATAVAVDDGDTVALVFFDRYDGNDKKFLQKLFSKEIAKVGHNNKDTLHQLLDIGIDPNGFIFDTAIGAYLLDATAGSYDIARLFITYFNEELPKATYLELNAFNLLGNHAENEANFASYCSAIADLYRVEKPLIEEKNLTELLETVELPLCKVLAKMECVGCKVDATALKEFSVWLTGQMDSLEKQIYGEAGTTFNINSPKQLGSILFDTLQLPHGKKTKTGWSTNADVLDGLKYQHPIVADILEYRQLAKLKSTYAEGLLKVIDADGRIRTSFQMTVTATGRLSSTEPNLQNIPTRTELGSEIRKLFIAEPGNVLVDADYSQIELRLLAHIAQDSAMRDAFLSGTDFHTATAMRVFGVDKSDVTHEMRRNAKAVNFGIVYGISAFSLSQDIGVTVAEAKDYMERYFCTYKGVKAYMESVVQKAKEQGYVETLMHRFRALPELTSSNFNLRSFGERVALNMPIQGTAADIMKLAMVHVDERLQREHLQAKLIMQVHDELIVECPENEKEIVEKLLQEEMENVMQLSVPLLAEAHSGRNWLEAKE